MKKLALVSLVSLATSAFAGQPVVSDSKKTVVPPEPCFGETELQLDMYGTYTWGEGRIDEGWGGGIALNFFFHRYLGVGLDANVAETGSTSWNVSTNLIARYPLELGGLCLAPYAKAGIGYHFDGNDDWFAGAGAGLEFRVTSRVGLFTEGSYNWAFGDGDDFLEARAGVRLVF